jgi:membrane associated rhomboid family serine protease
VTISLTTVVWLVVYVIVAGIIFGLLDYLIRSAPFIPDGWKPVLRWILMALGILVLCGILINLLGGGPVFRA